jgi:hypothetical protein
MKIPIIIIKFFFIGALFIVSNNNLHLQNHDDFSSFGNIYYNWLSSIFDHSKTIVGYVAEADWLPPLNDSSAAAKVLNTTPPG